MTPRWPYPRIVAHRGGGKLAPENTLAGIRKAQSMGFVAVEFDVMLAADRVPVLIHDETLERTTDGRGSVAQTPWARLAALDAGGWFGGAFSGERLPSFEQAGRLCAELGVWANVEIKPSKGAERETGMVAAGLARELWRGAALQPLLSSFEAEALEAARAAAPELKRGLLVDRVEPGWREGAERLECASLHCNQKYLTASLAREIHAAGCWLLVWTVNEPARAKRLLDWGVDAIVTDRLDLIPPDFA